MRKFKFIATAIVLLANAAFVASTFAQWAPNTTKDPRWTLEFGARAYDRPGDQLGLPLITDGVTMETLFDSGQASTLASSAGAEIKFGFVSDRGREFEIRSIITDWAQDFEITGSDLRSPFFPTAGFEPTTVNYEYTADYFSIEVMQRRAISPGITVILGPRFVSTKDQVKFSGTLGIDPGDGSGPVDVTETTIKEATNALIGLQTGFEINLPVSQDVYVNSFMRIGGYMNPTEVTTSVFNNVSPARTTTRETKSTGSMLAEVGGRLYVDIIPNGLATYVGYEATWIDGLALAPPQLLTAPGSGIETANTPFFHAITFGCALTY